ncbi:putative palmitoyltransferase ZDHHC14 [Sarcoptes scabiei]|nr:putative palmitoyltransferase ZDHHC14 [Sarcoptes scabiei]UXI22325.1 carbonic anhydrase-related protein 10 [Sarcoptes scabiei]
MNPMLLSNTNPRDSKNVSITLDPIVIDDTIHNSLNKQNSSQDERKLGTTTISSNVHQVPRWKIFPGRNRIFCNGRIIMAKQISVFNCTLALLISTCVAFFCYDCPFLYENISVFIPIVAGFLFIFVLLSLLRTSFTDPGIIPRATLDEAVYIEQQIVPNQSNSPTVRPPPRTKEVIINDQLVKLKYCFTCKIFRPPRASHCSLCDNCVERFDHHCPWVGNCVGKRNYRSFYMFIVSLAFLCIYVFACIITHFILLSKTMTLLDAVKQSPVSAGVLVICFISMWSILGLVGFHTYLIMSNLTTNEDIKGSFSKRNNVHNRNPYSKNSIFSNCYTVLCAPLEPSVLHLRSQIRCEENIVHIDQSNQLSQTNTSLTSSIRHPQSQKSFSITDDSTPKMKQNNNILHSDDFNSHRDYDEMINDSKISRQHRSSRIITKNLPKKLPYERHAVHCPNEDNTEAIMDILRAHPSNFKEDRNHLRQSIEYPLIYLNRQREDLVANRKQFI